MTQKGYNILFFFMLLLIIFLLIYIASGISWIKKKHKSLDNYINDNHYKFIRIFDNANNTREQLNELYHLKDSLDAKKNFIEGLEHDKKENTDAAKGNE